MSGPRLTVPIRWHEIVWVLWIVFVAPWVAWAAFRPFQDVGLAWAMASNPRGAGETVRDALAEAYGSIPGANMVAGVFLGMRQTAKQTAAIRRLPTRSATSASQQTGPYVLTIATDRGEYVPGQTVAVEITVRSEAPGWKPVVGAPDRYAGITISGPRGEPVFTTTSGTQLQPRGRLHACEEDRIDGCLAPGDEMHGAAYFTPSTPGDYVVTAQVQASWSPPSRATLRVHVVPAAAAPAVPRVSGKVRIGAILLEASAPAAVLRGSPVDVNISATNTGKAMWCPSSWSAGGELLIQVRRGSRILARTPFDIPAPTWHGLDIQGDVEGCLSPGHTATAHATWTAHSGHDTAPGLSGEPVPAGRYTILVGRGLGGFGSAVGVRLAETSLPVDVTAGAP